MLKQNILSLTLFFPYLRLLVTAQSITSGPLAPISIASETAYSTARACAAKCLIYNGDFQCGVNRGAYDLRLELACGCNAINGCYCSQGLQSSATSYLQSCVSAQCKNVGDAGTEVTSMLNFYGEYCRTANAAVEAVVSSTLAQSFEAASTPDAVTETSLTAAIASRSVIAGTAPVATSTSVGNEKGDKEGGLSKSDIIALATGIGVGLPSLVIAAIALFIQLRKRRTTAASHQLPAVPTSQIELPLMQNNGNWGNTGGVYAPGPVNYR